MWKTLCKKKLLEESEYSLAKPARKAL